MNDVGNSLLVNAKRPSHCGLAGGSERIGRNDDATLGCIESDSATIPTMPNVFGVRQPFEVANTIITPIAVFVVDGVKRAGHRNERLGYKPVNLVLSLPPIAQQINAQVSIPIGILPEDESGRGSVGGGITSHPSVVGNGIDALVSNDGSPSLYSVRIHAASMKGGVVSARTAFQAPSRAFSLYPKERANGSV